MANANASAKRVRCDQLNPLRCCRPGGNRSGKRALKEVAVSGVAERVIKFSIRTGLIVRSKPLMRYRTTFKRLLPLSHETVVENGGGSVRRAVEQATP